MVRATAPGLLRLKSMDGTFRVVGYAPPIPASHHLGVAVGFFEPDLMRDLRRTLLQGALLQGLLTLAVFGFTLMAARRFIAHPTHALLSAVRRWREGDLEARAPEQGQGLEFNQIGAACNAMAAALQRRAAEVQDHTESLESRVAARTQELSLANQRLQREIAERHHAEAALHQAQKVQAVGQLAGGIAHDFNNILQAVLGSVSLIRRRARDPAAVERLTAMVEDAARRGELVTRRLLAFSRREELRADILDTGELLAGLREVLGVTLGAAVRVEATATPGLPPVLADRGQLETVLVNLATNARDAMPGGGTLTLSATAETVAEADPPPEPAAGLRPGRYIRLSVADTGIGMSPAVLARAAEPFFTTKQLGRGTGLGLAMARSFAEGSGGSLDLESSEGRGTRVSLWLPVAQPLALALDPAAAPPAPALPIPADGSRLPRILLVDDDPIVREVLAAQLSDSGYEIAAAGDGPAALALLDRGEMVDVLVTDLAMPGLDGVALIRQAQQRRPGLPAILLTGYAGDAAVLAVGSVVDGAFSLLRKPVTGARLADAVATVLNKLEPVR